MNLERSAMTKILFITSHDEQEYQINAQNNKNLMEVAIENSIPGIIAECGGACACATCQVYIDNLWAQRVGPPNFMEEDMLDFAFEANETSRLACQIIITDKLDGLIVHVPKRQG